MNALAAETSPYLQQHADNPVQWYPWNPEALALARDSGKPILLSIGYSACHWCHVMAHESFEDPTTAEVMNRLYVNIKVDREERPDLDRIYQNAFQLLNQRAGGWPLTVFLTPDDHVPFFAGTYFPPEPRHGMPSFRDVLEQVAAFYHQNLDEISAQNERLLDALASFNPRPTQAARLDAAPLDQARQQLGAHYDRQYGGFGGAPKFPHPNNLERLLRHWAMTRDAGQADDAALEMVTNTLQAMAAG
ncbi:MAG TPA: thioredoxin domain-containing protein, partial [Gammaproteobacteria bacterium]|nr:thioredoxin domain-containing protein [Gammaproteobacteria bacterium]